MRSAWIGTVCGLSLACAQLLEVCVAADIDPALQMPHGPEARIEVPSCLRLALFVPHDEARCTQDAHDEWIRDLERYRQSTRSMTGYDGGSYELSESKWTQSSFIQALLLTQDRYLYDPAAGRYTVDRYLDDLDRRFGGIDSVILWPTYPNLGIDDTNQFDMVRALPGGVAGVRQMVADFHRRGVRVLLALNPWDTGTRDPGEPMPRAIAESTVEIGADGIYGDTMSGMPEAFVRAAESTHHRLVFDSEIFPGGELLASNAFSWDSWEEEQKDWNFSAGFVPKVDTQKWLEPRHMVHVSDRNSRDKTDELQYAFFNGTGWVSWENLWGVWNGITPRSGEAARRVATLQRFVAPFLASADWEPQYPMLTPGVFASRWPLDERTVWTLVNRNEFDVGGSQIAVPFREGEHYYDLYHGREIEGTRDGDHVLLSFPVEAHGFGALLARRGEPDAALVTFLKKMHAMTAVPLASYANEWHPLPQHLVPIRATRAAATPPPGMLEVPPGDFDFEVHGIEIEQMADTGADVQYPWETTPRRYHRRTMRIDRFFIDAYPVSNARFKAFLDSAHYHPKDDRNFLKDWKGGSYPAAWADKPVTWVSLEDARAYAAWAGKRLPHEWEWQYAAQGKDGRLYPWGNDWRADAVPVPQTERTLRGPDDSHAHPAGASPFGAEDMVGNVWQWTDEFADEHTRSAILRGGSYYQPIASLWYFPRAYRNDQHGKLLLMAPSTERAATLGFRCVVDAAAEYRGASSTTP